MSAAARRLPPGSMIGYDFHPKAHFDLAEIWEFIRADNLDDADRVIGETIPRSAP